MNTFFNPVCRIDTIPLGSDVGVTVDVLRLDNLHPIVSGNKWFKLHFYLSEARAAKKTVLTFGGAYSNHLVATAGAARLCGLKSIAVVRGEAPPALSSTLLQAKTLGMDLYFTSRDMYKTKQIPGIVKERYDENELSIIPEGGYGEPGMAGAKAILHENNTAAYSHIVSAVGTGTTLAGLAAAAAETQEVIGVSVLKNNFSLQQEIEHLLPGAKRPSFMLLHAYHFGGYAKRSAALLQFMNRFYQQTGIPTDFVYTGKTFFAASDLLAKNYFPAGSKVLLVHTGGLQGNRSLPKGTLIFGADE